MDVYTSTYIEKGGKDENTVMILLILSSKDAVSGTEKGYRKDYVLYLPQTSLKKL